MKEAPNIALSFPLYKYGLVKELITAAKAVILA
jgi:hypothetical protein